jgi:tetratricopeptide (TPR) repeat protein
MLMTCLRRGAFPAAMLLAATAGAVAAPRVPTHDAEVLERVRPANDPTARDLRDLTRRLRANPSDQAVALDLARRHLVIARTTSDPRHVGYAEAALAPWLGLPDPPTAVRLLRATMRQSRHEFDPALADLDAVLEAMPGNAQALLTRATIRLVRADLPGAARDCVALARRASALVATTCQAAVDAVSGQARRAADALERALMAAGTADPASVRAWALTVQAETFARLGDAAAAEARFRAALELDPDDVYTRAALADLLLETSRPAQARAVAEHDLRPDALLLRAALAAHALRAPDADALIARLLDRMEDAARRGDETHLREAARVRLDLLAEPRRALDLALSNFATQREPADALLLLRAARAAGQPQAARPALAWLDATGIDDAAISAAALALRP